MSFYLNSKRRPKQAVSMSNVAMVDSTSKSNEENQTTTNKFDYLSASVSKNVGNASLLPLILPNMSSMRPRVISTSGGGQIHNNVLLAPGITRASFVSSTSDSDEHAIMINTGEEVSSSSESSSSSSPSSSSSSSRLDYVPYKSHLGALLVLILICLNSVFVFYDCLCLHRLTSDRIPLWSALAHSLFIIW